MTDNIKLPPKPEMVQIDRHIPTNYVIRGYTAEQMEAYAREAVRLNMAPLSDEQIVKAVAAERERCAALCRRVADETRNSEVARAAGRMLANWISTGNPNDPGA